MTDNNNDENVELIDEPDVAGPSGAMAMEVPPSVPLTPMTPPGAPPGTRVNMGYQTMHRPPAGYLSPRPPMQTSHSVPQHFRGPSPPIQMQPPPRNFTRPMLQPPSLRPVDTNTNFINSHGNPSRRGRPRPQAMPSRLPNTLLAHWNHKTNHFRQILRRPRRPRRRLSRWNKVAMQKTPNKALVENGVDADPTTSVAHCNKHGDEDSSADEESVTDTSDSWEVYSDGHVDEFSSDDDDHAADSQNICI